MSYPNHGPAKNDSSNASSPVSPAARPALIEPLEPRQMLSATPAGKTVLPPADGITSHVVPLHAHATKADVIAARIAKFQAKLTHEVVKHPTLVNDVSFQQSISDQQTAFAAHIAREGGTYAPMTFTDIQLAAAAEEAARNAEHLAHEQAHIAAKVKQFQAHLRHQVAAHHKGVGGANLQREIDAEQAHFAATLASQGYVYTPISLFVGTTPNPSQPTVTGTAVSANEIDLSWTSVTNAQAYKLEVNTGSSWATLATPTGTTYAHLGLIADKVYQYRVTPLLASGPGTVSTSISVTTFLLPPSGFTAAAASATRVNLNWVAVTHATTYKIERSVNNTTWTALAPSPVLTGTNTSYADTTTLPGTTYYYRISATDAAGTSVPSAVLTVQTVAASPTLTATAVSNTEIDLTWNASTTAFSYKLERSANGGTTWATVVTQGGLTYNDTGLTTDTSYKYRVSAINGAGSSPVSTAATVATLLPSPTGVAALTYSSTRVDVSWNVVTHATGYKIERSADNTTWSALSPSPALTGTSTTYSDTTAVAGTQYYYRVSAIGAAGTSAPAAAVTATTLPAAPTLTATVSSATAVALSWAAVTGATSYKIETSTNGGSIWATLATQATLTYSNTGLTADRVYKYRVTAINATGASAPSATQTVTTLLPSPTGLSLSVVSSTSVKLTWVTLLDATSYKIERSLDQTTWTTVTPSPALSASSITYTDTGLTANTTYYYRLSGVDAAGTSAPCAALHALTLPTSPTLTAVPTSASQINLSWTAVVGISGFVLQRSADGGTTWASVATPTAATITYSDTGLTGDKQYKYRLSTTNATGNSAPSAVATATTWLAAPTGFTAAAASTTSIRLNWNSVTDATSLKIERSPDGTTWTALAPSPALAGTASTYTDTNLTAGTAYSYRITAINALGSSVASAVAQTSTLPVTPTLTATPISSTQINLSWTASTGASSYQLETSADGGANWSTLATQAGTTYNNTGLSLDTVYKYRITATSGSGASAVSPVITTTTLLAAAGGLTLTPLSATTMGLAWTPLFDATGYKLERSTDNTTWTAIVPSPALTGSSAAYTDTGLLGGTTYYYRISTVSGSGTTAPNSAVHALTAPAAPVLAGTVTSASAISLSWPAATGATSYLLETSADGGTTWTTLATQATLTYSHTGLTADSAHKYRVSAIDATGTSVASNVVTLTTMLGAPTGLAATVNSATRVTLSWAAVADATGYKIERSLDNTAWAALAPSPALTGSSTSYVDTTLAATHYYYRISAINAVGTSVTAAAVNVLTKPVAPVLTGTVTNAGATSLTWGTVASATSYVLEVSTDGGTTWATQATQATLTYAHTGLTADTAYSYRVSAANATGNSDPSNVLTLTTTLPAPSNFAATSPTATQVALSWTALAHATTYKIERSADLTTWAALAPASALTQSSNSYSDNTVVAGTTYHYRISATNAIGTSVTSAVVNILTLPAAPTLTAAVFSANQVNLSWTASTGATSYLLEYSTDGGTTWSTLAVPTTTTYSHMNLTSDTSYKYRVSATDATGNSVASAPQSVTTLLATPGTFTAVANTTTATTVDMTWAAVTHATTYRIDRSTDNANFTALTISPALAGTATSYSDTTASPGTVYYYRLAATNANGLSAYSPTLKVLTLPARPTLTATPASATSMTLAWAAVPGASSYLLETSTDGTTWTTLATQAGLTYSNTGLTADTAYQYRLTAINATGSSQVSTVVTSTTILVAPSGVSATASATAPTEIDLAWTAVTHATNYKIERSTDQTTWTTLVPSPALTGGSAAYADTTCLASTTYYYRVSAIDASGTSAPAAAVHALTIPIAPTLTAVAASSTSVSLSWTAVPGALTYTAEISTDGTNWTSVVTQAGLTATKTGLTADNAYIFRVRATNSTGDSPNSATRTVTTPLLAPTNITVAASTTVPAEVDMNWNGYIHATSYKIERSLDGTTWVTLAPNPALTGTTLSYVDTSVAPGTSYSYRFSTINANGVSAPSATFTATTLPVAPALTATVASATVVNLSWPASHGSTTYTLEQSTDGTTWASIATGLITSYSNTGLTADTQYQYRVRATDATGDSPNSNVATVTTLLASPAGFTATPNTTTPTEIDLAWTAVTHATTYKIERSQDQVIWTTLAPSPALIGSSATYADTSVLAGTQYHYRISAINANGASAVTAVAHPLTIPAAPHLTATVSSATAVALNWNAVKSATGYLVEDSSDGGTTWATVTTTPNASTTAASLTADTAYQFRVSAINATGNSPASNVQSVTTLLAAPTGFGATASTTVATEIDLAWTAVTHATNYKIERSTDQTLWTTLSPSPALTGSSAAYNDTTALAGTTYYYRISAIDAAGTSAPAAAAHALTIPATPTLTATVASATSVDLSWNAVTGATGYTLESSPDGTTWTGIATQAGTTYTNTGLTADTSYQYRVKATDATGNSPTSAVQTVTTLLASVTGFTATATTGSSTSMDLAWTAVTHATNYLIERSIDGVNWSTLTPSPALSGSSATYADTGLLAGTTYYYRLSAINANGTSAATTAVHTITRSATPAATAAAVSATEVDLAWTPSLGATGYLIESSSDGGTTWATVTTATGLTYANTGLTADTSYQYRVSAVNASGNSAPSSVQTVSTLLLAPAGFTATPSTTVPTEIDLAWTAVTHASNYLIERSPNGVLWTTLSPSPALTGTSHAYADTSVAAGTSYYYRISAIGTAGTSAPTTPAQTLSIPAAPTVTTKVVSATEIDLAWNNVKSATSYIVESSTDGTTWTQLGTPTAALYANTGLTADTAYQYRVTAVNATGNSPTSSVVTASTLLAAPSGFTVTAVSGSEVDLAWTAVTHATNYLIEVSTDNVSFTAITPSPALTGSSHAFADMTVTPATQYYYRISSVNGAGTSASTAATGVFTPLAAPTGLTATAVSATQINLAWDSITDPSLTSWIIQSSSDGTTWANYGSVSSSQTSASIFGLTTATTYYYRLIAVNSGGNSAASAPAHTTTM